MSENRAWVVHFHRADPLGRRLPGPDGKGPITGSVRVFARDDLEAKYAATCVLDEFCVIERAEPEATKERCIPPTPDEDGWHWVRRYRTAPPIPIHWDASWHRNAGRGWGDHSQPDREHQWEYIAPCPMPDVARTLGIRPREEG